MIADGGGLDPVEGVEASPIGDLEGRAWVR
jgi:hypothetical protein